MAASPAVPGPSRATLLYSGPFYALLHLYVAATPCSALAPGQSYTVNKIPAWTAVTVTASVAGWLCLLGLAGAC